MQQGYELLLTGIKKDALEHSDHKNIYIPLYGKHTINLEEEPFDLAEKIHSFFVFNESSTNDPKVMLLMGDTGSGKSVFSQQLYQQLCKNYQTGNPIPLWIPLPELQNPFKGALEEVLSKDGLDDGKIAEIKEKERFIFVVDGYDELHQFQNCYVTNKWEKWNAKILITCRSQALYYQTDYEKYFMPFNGERRLPLLLRKLYVAAFSAEQISAYVIKYRELNSDTKIAEEDFTKVPGLTKLIKTPFLLHCAVEALPDILASHVDDEKMTQAKLYDVFIERWFTRQVKKLSAAGLLKDTEQATKQRFWDYCKKLAQQMHAKEVSVIPYQGEKGGGRLFGKQQQTDSWASFFGEETEVVRSACPLRRYGEYHYGFVHASMVEYFATRAMYEEILINQHREDEEYLEEKENPDNTGESARYTNQPSDGIHQRLFSLERQSIQFLADRIEMSEAFKQKLLLILEASKKSQHFAIGAANAITALVRAGVPFNRQNLSGIKISGADISGGYFDQADLSASDLRQSQMRNVWLRGANLEGSHVDGINFGEYPLLRQDSFENCFDYRDDLQRVVSGFDNDLILSDTIIGERLNKLQGHSSYAICAQFSPNGKWIVSGSNDNTLRIWEVTTGAEIAVLHGHENGVNCVAFSAEGKRVVSGSDDKTVRLWDIANKVVIVVLQGHEAQVSSVAYSPGGQQVVSGSWDNTVRIWDINSSKVKMVLQGHEDWVSCVAYSPNGKTIASGSNDKTVRIWDVASGKQVARLNGHNSRLSSIAFSPLGEQVISGSEDHTVRIWEIGSQKEFACLRGHTSQVKCVQFSADGKRAISVSNDESLRVWVIPEEPSLLRSRIDYRAKFLHLSPDGEWVVSGNDDRTVRICERQDMKEHVVLRGDDSILCVGFSPDGRQVVSGGLSYKVSIWDLECPQVAHLLEVPSRGVWCVQYDPTGTWVALGCRDKTVRLWSATTGKALTVLEGHQGWVKSVAFSQDGKRILSGSSDNTVRLWEVSTGKLLTLLEGFEYVLQAVFCPHEEAVAVGGKGTITIVNLKSKQKICVLDTQEVGWINKIHFMGDGQRMIVSMDSATVQIWDITHRKCINSSKFHTVIRDYAYHNNGSFVMAFMDGAIQCWQIMGDGYDYRWRLIWTTHIDSPSLFVEGLVISDVMGLSDQNCRLLEQGGALAKPHPLMRVETSQAELQELSEPPQQETVQEQHKGDQVHRASLAKPKWNKLKRTGSPIHQNNNNEPKSDNTEEEEKARRCVIA